MENLVSKIEGPILVLGGAGFIGRHLVKYLTAAGRKDVHAGDRTNSSGIMETKKVKTLFNCAGRVIDVGAPRLDDLMSSNFFLVKEALASFFARGGETFIHAGSAAEYGDALVGPKEDHVLEPSSFYAASKAAASQVVWAYGKTLGKRAANLRFYNVYGSGDKESRLPSRIVEEGKRKRYPLLGHPATARDFVHVDDACRAFVFAAVNLKKEKYGEAFNIGGDVRTLSEIANYAKKIFKIKDDPVFDLLAFESMWASDSHKAEEHLGFKSEISLFNGLKRMAKEES